MAIGSTKRGRRGAPAGAAVAGPEGWISRLFSRWSGHSAASRRPHPTAAPPEALAAALAGAATDNGESLRTLAAGRPRLVVLLRHLGCTFCRETLADLARARPEIERRGVGIVLVHLARDDERARRLFEIYRLADLPRIADPERRLYLALGLDHGRVGDLLRPHVLARTLVANCRGHLPGRIGGDTRQMPGVFLLHRDRIVAGYRHRTVADRPDYVALAGAPRAERTA